MQAIITCDRQEERGPYRQLLLNCGIECGAGDTVLYADLMPRLNRGGAELLIVALGKDPKDTLQLVRKAHEGYSLPILILGPSHDAQLILQAMQAGAREYLDLEMGRLRERLGTALEKLRKTGAIQFRRGRSIVVTGAVPGSGVTTVSSGLAFALGALYPKQVLLAELDSRVPELALDLDLEPRNPISQLLLDWQRVDASAVRQAAMEHAGGVYVLAETPSLPAVPEVEADACTQLVSLVRTMYDYAVYDCGHGAQTVVAQQAVRTADHVVVVVRLDVPSLRLTRAFLSRLADLGMPRDSLSLVGNRYGQKQQLDWKKAEDALGTPVNVWLPDDPADTNQALNLGQPLTQVSSWAKINRRLVELAEQVNAKLKQ